MSSTTWVRFPAVQDFLFFTALDRLCSPPNFLSQGYRRLFFSGIMCQGRQTDHTHLDQEIWSYSSTSLYVFMKFTFTLACCTRRLTEAMMIAQAGHPKFYLLVQMGIYKLRVSGTLSIPFCSREHAVKPGRWEYSWPPAATTSHTRLWTITLLVSSEFPHSTAMHAGSCTRQDRLACHCEDQGHRSNLKKMKLPLPSTLWRRNGELMYISTFSWPRH
jgi:hypothetical protein